MVRVEITPSGSKTQTVATAPHGLEPKGPLYTILVISKKEKKSVDGQS